MCAAVKGVMVGEVIDLEDPENLGRVRVRYPELNDVPSDWARLATPMAGQGRGTFFRPEVGDEVLVAFVHGEMRFPHVIGSLWSKPDPPPPDDGNAAENNWRFFRSRSGHLIKLDDTDGSETIEFEDKDGARRIVIEAAGQKIRVECDSGDVEVTAGSGNITIDASGTVEVRARSIALTADAEISLGAPSISVEADGDLTLKSGGTCTVKGSIVQIN